MSRPWETEMFIKGGPCHRLAFADKGRNKGLADSQCGLWLCFSITTWHWSIPQGNVEPSTKRKPLFTRLEKHKHYNLNMYSTTRKIWNCGEAITGNSSRVIISERILLPHLPKNQGKWALHTRERNKSRKSQQIYFYGYWDLGTQTAFQELMICRTCQDCTTKVSTWFYMSGLNVRSLINLIILICKSTFICKQLGQTIETININPFPLLKYKILYHGLTETIPIVLGIHNDYFIINWC